jgi:ABC-type multidrug transport system ATPase subunit
LLDVLAQRKDFGEIRGSILIDGKPQGVSFQRMTGYCEQMDVHEGTSTVKEALVFSALLRQPSTVPEAEKLAYVEHIIDLLELRDICDALIGGAYHIDPLLWPLRLLTFPKSLEPASASNSGSA